MDTLHGLLTPFGQTVVGLTLLVLAISGIYYWCERLASLYSSRRSRKNNDLPGQVKQIEPLSQDQREEEILRRDLGNFSLLAGMQLSNALTNYLTVNGEIGEKASRGVGSAVGKVIASLHLGHILLELPECERGDIALALKEVAEAHRSGDLPADMDIYRSGARFIANASA